MMSVSTGGCWQTAAKWLQLACPFAWPLPAAEIDQKRVRSATSRTEVIDGFTVLRTLGRLPQCLPAFLPDACLMPACLPTRQIAYFQPVIADVAVSLPTRPVGHLDTFRLFQNLTQRITALYGGMAGAAQQPPAAGVRLG